MNRFQIVRFDHTDSTLIAYAFDIRTRVFIDEQNVPYDLERDEFDKEAVHYIMMYGQKPIAAARRRRTGKGVKLERFAVLKEYRNQGIGSRILKYVLSDLQNEQEQIYLNAQEAAVPFYKRHGFRIKGDAFMEAGIRHYLMVYKE
ncbi:MAG: GNAT family N-acetyltransferase [Bacteroidales bacterium]|nr:GNAT family N-acetyltransferase [Bacteroidales bacterium]